MSREDPIAQLRYAVKAADDYRELCLLIDTARQIDENSKSTLKRLLRERQEIVEMMRGLHIPYKGFDFEYKEGLAWRLRDYLDKNYGIKVEPKP